MYYDTGCCPVCGVDALAWMRSHVIHMPTTSGYNRMPRETIVQPTARKPTLGTSMPGCEPWTTSSMEVTYQIVCPGSLLDQPIHLIRNSHHLVDPLFLNVTRQFLLDWTQVLFSLSSHIRGACVLTFLQASVSGHCTSYRCSGEAGVGLTFVHSTSGSCTKASRTVINDSELVLRICRLISAAFLKTPYVNQRDQEFGGSGEHQDIPSVPLTPIASTMLWVSLNGTLSGISNVFPYHQSVRCAFPPRNRESKLTLSNRQFKSTWTVSPVRESKRIFSPCRSPSLISSASLIGRDRRLTLGHIQPST